MFRETEMKAYLLYSEEDPPRTVRKEDRYEFGRVSAVLYAVHAAGADKDKGPGF